jgi:hypothetical protein
MFPRLRSLVTTLDLDHGANKNACVCRYKAKTLKNWTSDSILSGARGILETVSTTRGMAYRELKGNGWKIYMDERTGEAELPGGTVP